MDRHIEIYKVLLLLAFLSQGAIDILGASGASYNSYDPKIYEYLGFNAILSVEASFIIYLVWMIGHYLSLASLAIFHWSAWFFIPISLLGSILIYTTSGVYVTTPMDSFLGLIAGVSYDVAIAMAFFSPSVSGKICASFRKFIDPNDAR